MTKKSLISTTLTTILLCSLFVSVHCGGNTSTALLIIDVQDFYFPGGNWELENPEPASLNAKKILERFRETDELVVHVRHDAQPGGEIHQNVRPVEGEKVITKKSANAFKDSDLLDYLQEGGVDKLVICGMMTHMCVEAATRAAHDLGFACTVIGDACATKALTYEGKTISAEDVHYATLRTLSGGYARVMNTEDFLKEW